MKRNQFTGFWVFLSGLVLMGMLFVVSPRAVAASVTDPIEQPQLLMLLASPGVRETLPLDTTLTAQELNFRRDFRRAARTKNVGGFLGVFGGLISLTTAVLIARPLDCQGCQPYIHTFVYLPMATAGISLTITGIALHFKGRKKLNWLRSQMVESGVKVSISPSFGPKQAGMRLAMAF